MSYSSVERMVAEHRWEGCQASDRSWRLCQHVSEWNYCIFLRPHDYFQPCLWQEKPDLFDKKLRHRKPCSWQIKQVLSAKTWWVPNPNTVVFVPEQHQIENGTSRKEKFWHKEIDFQHVSGLQKHTLKIFCLGTGLQLFCIINKKVFFTTLFPCYSFLTVYIYIYSITINRILSIVNSQLMANESQFFWHIFFCSKCTSMYFCSCS